MLELREKWRNYDDIRAGRTPQRGEMPDGEHRAVSYFSVPAQFPKRRPGDIVISGAYFFDSFVPHTIQFLMFEFGEYLPSR
jgi:hypothetical protein